MRLPIQILFRNVRKSNNAETLIRERVSRLEKLCDNITRCSIAVEKPNHTVKAGNPYRVRIDLTVSPGHEIVVSKEQGQNDGDDPLFAVIREAFDATKKRLEKLVHVKRRNVKAHYQKRGNAED